MPRIKVAVTEEVYQALENYRASHELPSLSAAAAELIGRALGIEDARPQWGGDRRSESFHSAPNSDEE